MARPPYRSLPGPSESTFHQTVSPRPGSSARRLSRIWRKTARRVTSISARSTSGAPLCTPGSFVQTITPAAAQRGRAQLALFARATLCRLVRPPYRSLAGPTEPAFPIRQGPSGSSARRLPRIWGKPARRAGWCLNRKVTQKITFANTKW